MGHDRLGTGRRTRFSKATASLVQDTWACGGTCGLRVGLWQALSVDLALGRQRFFRVHGSKTHSFNAPSKANSHPLSRKCHEGSDETLGTISHDGSKCAGRGRIAGPEFPDSSSMPLLCLVYNVMKRCTTDCSVVLSFSSEAFERPKACGF